MSDFEQRYAVQAQEKLAHITKLGFAGGHLQQVVSNTSIAEVRDQYAVLANPDTQVITQGRITAIRTAGKKLGFVDIASNGEKIQLCFRANIIDPQCFEAYRLLDVGDIIQIHGSLFRTKSEELTVQVNLFHLLTKSFRPPFDSFTGLTDVESKYRQRYLDLIANPESLEMFKTRSMVVANLRSQLGCQNFIEVETPMLQSHPSGATATPFRTHHNALGQDMYLRIAPELHLKRLIVGGFERVFEINRCFRNEGLSTRHNPEFTTLEYYEAYTTFDQVMHNLKSMLHEVAKHVGSTHVDFANIQVIDMRDAILQAMSLTHFTRENFDSVAFVNQLLPKDAPYVSDNGANIMTIFEHLVEPNLIRPTIITGFPKSVSPLAACYVSDTNWAQRFEVYCNGMELGNGFVELNDSADQLIRFNDQSQNDPDAFVDLDYIEALSYGMPPTVGVGLGIDRLVMLLTNAVSIKDVILFPTLRS